ncbi:MAG: hypothetical protein AB7S44_02225 [Spirochaetales bacterium]
MSNEINVNIFDEMIENITPNGNLKRVKFVDGFATFMNEYGSMWRERFLKAYLFGHINMKNDSYTLVQLLNGKFVFIDRKNNRLTEEYDGTTRFRSGFIRVFKGKAPNNKYYLDDNLKEIAGPFVVAEPFVGKTGCAAVQLKNDTWALLQRDGKLKNNRYDAIIDLYEDNVVALKNGVRLVLDMDENILNYTFRDRDYSEEQIYAKKPLIERIKEDISLDPRKIRNFDKFLFLNDESLTLINTNIEEHLQKVRDSDHQIIPFWSNEKYIAQVKELTDRVISDKQKEAKIALVRDYYSARIEDVNRTYNTAINTLKAEKQSALIDIEIEMQDLQK